MVATVSLGGVTYSSKLGLFVFCGGIGVKSEGSKTGISRRLDNLLLGIIRGDAAFRVRSGLEGSLLLQLGSFLGSRHVGKVGAERNEALFVV